MPLMFVAYKTFTMRDKQMFDNCIVDTISGFLFGPSAPVRL